MSRETRPPPRDRRERISSDTSELVTALVLIWSNEEPDRAGEVLLLHGEEGGRPESPGWVIGRSDPDYDYGGRRLLVPLRQRPGGNEPTPPLLFPEHASRRQVDLAADISGRIRIRNAGKGAVSAGGHPIRTGESITLDEGGTLKIPGGLFYCTRRPVSLPSLRFYAMDPLPAFGLADQDRLVGESPAMWAVRDQIGYLARMGQHALLHGPSGGGKELIARAVHRHSARGGQPIVTHSAADIPPSLIEAELFGNRKDYPNAGTPAREGLIGQADGSTLFLDEIGVLGHDLQAKLLRVLDENGEYRRLGVDEALRSDFRLLTATNQSTDQIRHDLLGRLKLMIAVPGLNQRPEDVPLLARHLTALTANRMPRGTGTIRFDVELMDALVQHDYTLNIRELEQLLLVALFESQGEVVRLTEGVSKRLRVRSRFPLVGPDEASCDLVKQALLDHGWNIGEAARALGWSRFQLNRKMKKCGLAREDAG